MRCTYDDAGGHELCRAQAHGRRGPGRAPQFAAAFSRYIKEIAHTAGEDTPDLEYTWATMDKRLAQIYGEHFVPAKERYGR